MCCPPACRRSISIMIRPNGNGPSGPGISCRSSTGPRSLASRTSISATTFPAAGPCFIRRVSNPIKFAVRTANLIGFETRLIKHGPAAGNVVAEIDVRDARLRGPVDDRQDIPGPEGPFPFGRIIIEIDRRQAGGQHIYIPHGDELVAEEV